MRDVVCQQTYRVPRPSINLDPVFGRDRHCPKTVPGSQENDVVVELLPGKINQSERRFFASQLRRRCQGAKWEGSKDHNKKD